MFVRNGHVAGSVIVAELATAAAEPKAVETEEQASDFTTSEPPKAGRGSSREEWVKYAESQGFEVTDDMTRDEIIEAVEEE